MVQCMCILSRRAISVRGGRRRDAISFEGQSDGQVMLMLDKTSERLRSKHVRTLELLQKTLDENVELRDRVSQLQKGTLHLSQGEPRSNRINELEDEINRLNAEHCGKLLATEEAARVRHSELFKTIDGLQAQQQKLQNEVFSLETRLTNARDALQNERVEWKREREHLLHENTCLRQELACLSQGNDDSRERHIEQIERLQKELDVYRQLHSDADERNLRLQNDVTLLHKDLNEQKERYTTLSGTLATTKLQTESLLKQEAALRVQLDTARAENDQLQTRVEQLQATGPQIAMAQPVVVPDAQTQLAATLTQLHQIEERNSRLVGENRALQEALAKLQTNHAELTRASSVNGSIFATHIDLKRENFHLRAQVEELKQLQKRYLTTANKKTMKFPAI